MKTPSEELFSLIHSLAQNEKRYFVLFTRSLGGRKKEKRYLELFRIIERSPQYDERRVKARLGGMSPSAFKKLKHYTYSLILKGLENFHSASSDDIIINRYLQQAEILFQKKQLVPALKMVDRALHVALEKDRLLLVLPCYEWKLNIALASGRPREGLAGVEEKMMKKYAADAGRWLEIRRSVLYFWEIIHHRDEIGPSEKKTLEQLVRKTLKIYRSAPSGYTITKETCSTLALCYRYLGKWNESYAWRKKLAGLIEGRKQYLNESGPEYVVALGNLMNACREMKRDGEVVKLFRKVSAFMEKLPQRFHDLHLDERYCNVINGYISFLHAQRKYHQAVKLGEELMIRIRKHSGVFQNSLVPVLFDNVMFSWFGLRDIRQCRRYYSQWMRHSSRTELAKRLFGFILSAEAGDKDHCEHQARAILYHVRKDRKSPPWMKTLSRLLYPAITRASDPISEKELYRIIYKAMLPYREQLKTDTGIDVCSWLLDRS